LSGVPIAIAGVTGSLTVISVNAWMQHPSGFHIVGGHVVGVHPLGALFGNSFLWNELIHMYLAGFIVAGFLLATPYALKRLRGELSRYERTALAIPLSVGAVVAPVQVLVGDWVARDVAAEQPTKLAAIEGLPHTTRGASEHLLGWYTGGHVKFGIAIPKLLSLLAFHNPNATVQGLDAVPPSQRPPVNIERITFQLMVAIGTGLALLGVWFLWVRWRAKRLPAQRWFYAAVAAAGPLSVVALICGWIVTEAGRQPWVVYHVMRTREAVTNAAGIPVGYGVLAATYLLVAAAVAWVLRRLAARPLVEHSPPKAEGAGASPKEA
ncbi:MAG TPA: cytochrome ubiquinol oxidase subunit I, partial [Solirubrobacteraceae bacterium]